MHKGVALCIKARIVSTVATRYSAHSNTANAHYYKGNANMGTKQRKGSNKGNSSTAQVAAPQVQEQVAAPQVQGKTGLRIQKVRASANGVTRPSAGGKCAAVWDFCDSVLGSTGSKPTVAQVRAWGAAQGYNVNNAQIEYYAWCKHNGLSRAQLAHAAKQVSAQ